MYYVWHYSGELVGKFATKVEAFEYLDINKAYRVTYVREA